ncbi:lysophospholipid acyltransferase family protein [Paenibacillus radicis (ex Xue et al. 2023)]|uniref:1-acyl-sn-glycerol-3-phosphate acyltransferase n=1 Tax=Paenibacillus radicis (ex Xue et al. 2023) TaxID=2972489 RepID=A0ABT1YR40_9BACL|nr:lysophospholipid acyltransferase family protein [Paenibacillus radicis (ex Xue et al. 2023)]MCR8634440.1 1-acyl-sn-glycerol-3-phosphate acyltransferase [Paenibacillus radicis (ex Xue et al. 2023)]
MLYSTLRALFHFIFRLVFRLKVVGLENVPHGKPVILCANHTSNMDPPLLGSPLVGRRVHYMAKAELFDVPVLGWVLPRISAFPVKRGGVSKESIRLSLQLLSENKILGIFPEGSRSNAGGMGKKGAASLALKSGATVVPAAIVGGYKPFKQLTLVYGKPVDISEFADQGSEGLEQATDKILSVIRTMVKQYESK